MMPTDIPNTKLLERIRSRCAEDKVSGCWEYKLSVNNSQYANTLRHAIELGGASEMVQGSRLVYTALKGEIPEGHEIDHLCKNRRCLNGWHMEPVLPSINKQRNRLGERHPLSAWLFPNPEVAMPTFSSTMFIFAST